MPIRVSKDVRMRGAEVREQKEAVNALADALVSKGHLSEKEVPAIVKQTRVKKKVG